MIGSVAIIDCNGCVYPFVNLQLLCETTCRRRSSSNSGTSRTENSERCGNQIEYFIITVVSPKNPPPPPHNLTVPVDHRLQVQSNRGLNSGKSSMTQHL